MNIQDIDFAILDAIQSLNCGFMDWAMRIISLLGGVIIWIAAAGVMLLFKAYRRKAVNIIVCVSVAAVISEFVLKFLFMRERPFLLNETHVMIVSAPIGTSFPSTHTTLSFSAAVGFFYAKRQLGFIALGFAFLVALSRLYLYVHFPSDVLGGSIIGTLIGLSVIFLMSLFWKWVDKRKNTV